MMVAFTGRSQHTLKMPNKPIDEGYKIYAICDHGYTYGFEFYSLIVYEACLLASCLPVFRPLDPLTLRPLACAPWESSQP